MACSRVNFTFTTWSDCLQFKLTQSLPHTFTTQANVHKVKTSYNKFPGMKISTDFFKGSQEKEVTGPHTTNQTCGWSWQTVGRLWTIFFIASILCPVISVSLLASNLKQTVMWSKLSISGYRHLTIISSIAGYKPWCCGATNASSSVVTMWRPKCTICLPCAAYTWKTQRSFYKSLCIS